MNSQTVSYCIQLSCWLLLCAGAVDRLSLYPFCVRQLHELLILRVDAACCLARHCYGNFEAQRSSAIHAIMYFLLFSWAVAFTNRKQGINYFQNWDKKHAQLEYYIMCSSTSGLLVGKCICIPIPIFWLMPCPSLLIYPLYLCKDIIRIGTQCNHVVAHDLHLVILCWWFKLFKFARS